MKQIIIVFIFVGLCTCKSRETEGTKFLCHFKDLAEFPCGDILSSMPLPTSSLLVGCHDEFLDVDSVYKNGTITIRTTYKKVQNGLDPPEGQEYIQKQLARKYHIDDNYHFVE